jgi:hypothetical protein
MKKKIFKKSPQLPGATCTRAWHHHGTDTPNSPRAIYILRSAKQPAYLPTFDWQNFIIAGSKKFLR